MTRLLAIDGSPRGDGRTHTVLAAVLDGAHRSGAATASVSLADIDRTGDHESPLAEVRRADAFVFGSPVYRASYAAPLKSFLDAVPRGRWGETEQPITARAVGVVLTGATWQHYLALNDLRNVLSGFFGSHVLAPGLYVPSDGFTETKDLTEAFVALAQAQGAGLVALAAAIAASPELQAVGPQV